MRESGAHDVAERVWSFSGGDETLTTPTREELLRWELVALPCIITPQTNVLTIHLHSRSLVPFSLLGVVTVLDPTVGALLLERKKGVLLR